MWVRGRFLKEPAAERVGFPSFPTEAPPSSGTAVYQQRSLSVLVPWVFLRAYRQSFPLSVPVGSCRCLVLVVVSEACPMRVLFWLRSLSSSKTQSFHRQGDYSLSVESSRTIVQTYGLYKAEVPKRCGSKVIAKPASSLCLLL